MANQNYPIKYWSYSSIIAYLRNPLAWYKRYVKGIYDIPVTPSSVIGSAAHVALKYFYNGLPSNISIKEGLKYLKSVHDFEINFGKATSRRARRKKRQVMEADYHKAISFYLERPPRHKVLGVEVKAFGHIPGIPIPVKAVSDLVVVSRINKDMVDIIDHKFVNAYGSFEIDNPLFVIQALFNYYTVLAEFKRPVKRFIVYECKKTRNQNGKPQLRRHIIEFKKHENEFALFHRLLADATQDVRTRRVFLPNPSDILEGKNSLELYRLDLAEN